MSEDRIDNGLPIVKVKIGNLEFTSDELKALLTPSPPWSESWPAHVERLAAAFNLGPVEFIRENAQEAAAAVVEKAAEKQRALGKLRKTWTDRRKKTKRRPK